MWERKCLVPRRPGALLALGGASIVSCALALSSLPAAATAAPAAYSVGAKAPAAPTGVVAAESLGDLTVGWKAVSGATGYEVLIRNVTTKQKRFTKATWSQDPISSTPLADIDFGDFSAGDVYAFEVVATNAAGDSPASAPATVTAVGFPETLYSAAGNRAAVIGWQDPPGATSYRVLQYDNCDFDYSSAKTVTAKQFPIKGADGNSTWVYITGLANGRCYDFVVEAYNSRDGDYPAVSGEDNLLEPIGTPGWKAGTAAGNGSARLEWSTTNGASQYVVYMANQTKGKNNYSRVKTVRPGKGATQSLTVAKLVNGDKYSFYIVAENDYSGQSSTGVKNLTPGRGRTAAGTGASQPTVFRAPTAVAGPRFRFVIGRVRSGAASHRADEPGEEFTCSGEYGISSSTPIYNKKNQVTAYEVRFGFSDQCEIPMFMNASVYIEDLNTGKSLGEKTGIEPFSEDINVDSSARLPLNNDFTSVYLYQLTLLPGFVWISASPDTCSGIGYNNLECTLNQPYNTDQ